MKAVVLAAGYAKRLPHHVRTTPKALLPIAGQPLIDLILRQVLQVPDIDEIFIITNNVYLPAFRRWAETFPATHGISQRAKDTPALHVDSDGTSAPHEKLGALGDLHFVVQQRNINSDLLVIAGDNFFEFKITEFVEHFHRSDGPIVALSNLGDPKRLAGRFGVAEFQTDTSRVTSFSEKPEHPESSLASTLCYIFTPRELNLLAEYRRTNPHAQETGSFLAHLIHKNVPVFGYRFDERWVDIGDYDDYHALNQTELKRRLEQDTSFKQSIDAVILFGDIVASATISEYSSEEDYDDFISEFQTLALSVIDDNLQKHGVDAEDQHFCEYSVRGDETVLLLYTKRPERDINMALDVAIELKRKVFLSRFNRNRQGRSFFDVGIGIHYGRVVLKQHPSATGARRNFNAEGYSINLTKRIEAYSRKGTFSKIMLSKRFADLVTRPMVLSKREDVTLTGIYGAFPIHELQVCGNYGEPEYFPQIAREDIDYYVAALENSPYDIWLSLMVARHYFDEEEYPTAEKYYMAITQSLPDFAVGHRYLGRNFYRQNKFREARQALERACELDPLSSKAHNFLAVTLRRLNEYSLALEHHENATKFEPDSPYEYNAFAYTIAEAWTSSGDRRYDLRKAESYLAMAETLFGASRDNYLYILEHTHGMIRFAGRYVDEAIACFTKVIESIDQQPGMMPRKREEKRLEALYHVGLVHYQTGNRNEALTNLLASLKSPEIAAGERLPYYWFGAAREKVDELKAALDT